MHYIGVAVDASKREVRIALIDETAPTDLPQFRTLTYGRTDLPLALRDLHAAIRSTLHELPPRAVGVRRQDSSSGQSGIRNATIDRLLAEGAVLAAARDVVTDVRHLTGADAGVALGVSKQQALSDAKTLLASHGEPAKWAEAAMIAKSLI